MEDFHCFETIANVKIHKLGLPNQNICKFRLRKSCCWHQMNYNAIYLYVLVLSVMAVWITCHFVIL
jgi:hypothetical protein